MLKGFWFTRNSKTLNSLIICYEFTTMLRFLESLCRMQLIHVPSKESLLSVSLCIGGVNTKQPSLTEAGSVSIQLVQRIKSAKWNQDLPTIITKIIVIIIVQIMKYLMTFGKPVNRLKMIRNGNVFIKMLTLRSIYQKDLNR